jgi:hypothetical protein
MIGRPCQNGWLTFWTALFKKGWNRHAKRRRNYAIFGSFRQDRPAVSLVAARDFRDSNNRFKMKIVAILLAFSALTTGLIAAWYWYRSTLVPIEQNDERRQRI